MASIDTQELLGLLEETHKLCFWDLECSGLNGDYNSILVASVKPYGKPAKSFQVKKVGSDKQLVKDLKAELESYSAWCGYYSKGFDLKMLRSKLLLHEMDDIEMRPHIDLYFALRFALNTSRRSQAHYADWLGTPEKKMSVSANVWAEVSAEPKKHLKTLVARCESDVAGLEDLYDRTRHLIKDLKR